MTTRYRMVGWLGLLGLVGGTLSASAQAPTREDSIKGKIWSATAQQVWAVAPKMPAAQLKPWSTSQDFNTWLKSQANAELAKQSELGMLQSKVVERVKVQNQGSPNATAGQVAAAILAEIGQQQEAKLKMGRLARLDLAALTTNLTPYVPAAAPVANPTNPVAAQAGANQTTPPANNTGAAVEVPDDKQTPDTPAALSPEPNYPPAAVTVSNATYFGLSPYAAMAVIGLLGAGLGAFLFAQFGPRRSSRHSYRPPTPASTSDLPVKDTPEYKKLRQAYDKLQREVNELKRQIAELRGQSVPMAPPPAEPELEADDLFQVAPAVAPHDVPPPAPAPAERPAAAPTALTLYGPVQETPFLEERKIVDSPLPQLALMLTIDPRRPEQASFTLNPQVNQVMLIGDGLNRLQKFFDYDMPMGRISSVTAAAPGKLQRQADGWQVVERARLTIR